MSRGFDDLLKVLDTYKRFVEEDKQKIQAYSSRLERLESACRLLLTTSTLSQSQHDAILDFIEGLD